MPQEPDPILAELNAPPPTDETGNVDLSLIEYCLSLTPAARLEQHYQARLSAEAFRHAGERYYGSPHPDTEALQREQR